MKRPARRVDPPRPKLASETLATLLDIVRSKFYAGHAVEFAKDRPRLLSWVILWPATWLSSRGVTLPPDRYAAILGQVLVEAAAFSEPTKVTYLPAYLRQCMQSHWRIHGEEYYEEGKAIRTKVEATMFAVAQQPRQAAPDPVRELAQAASLLRATKRPKTVLKPAPNDQLTLL